MNRGKWTWGKLQETLPNKYASPLPVKGNRKHPNICTKLIYILERLSLMVDALCLHFKIVQISGYKQDLKWNNNNLLYIDLSGNTDHKRTRMKRGRNI